MYPPIAPVVSEVAFLAWAADWKHDFTEVVSDTGMSLFKLDLDSGEQEPWQVIKPQEQIGLRADVSPPGTPPGAVAFTNSTQLGQLYGT